MKLISKITKRKVAQMAGNRISEHIESRAFGALRWTPNPQLINIHLLCSVEDK